MEKLDIRKLKTILGTRQNYIALAIAFAVMLLIYPIEGKFKYNYKKGAPWGYEDLNAPIDFPILKTPAELALERDNIASNLVPYYTLNPNVLKNILIDFSKASLNAGLPDSLKEAVQEQLKRIYTIGVLPEKELSSRTVFIRGGRHSVKEVEAELYTTAKAYRSIRANLLSQDEGLNADSVLNSLNIQSLIIPNLNYDKKSTEELHRQAIDYISPTKGIIYAGQNIVLKGETVTAEIAQILDSFKAEFKRSVGYSGNLGLLIIGHALIIIALLLMVCIAVYFSDPEILRRLNQFYFILFICCLNFALPVIVGKFSNDFLYLIPLAVSSLYMAAFILNRVILPVYFISLLPLLLIAENGVELYLLNAVAGAVAFFSFSINERGWVQFLNSVFMFLALALVHLGYSLISTGVIGESRVFLYLFLSAILTVVTYPITFLLEKVFYMVSVATLKDFADADNHILRELSRKAPGTFQHSLSVANLAERAAIAIGGRAIDVRVGALYHDIGKIMNPQAFIENQAPGINYHSSLSPLESAAVIIKHVEDGLLLAKQYKLPDIICGFIASHHARSVTEYFYNVYCNAGGSVADKDKFTYHGSLPSTKEEVIVLMADAVEAASRSLKEYSEQSISALVDSVIAKRTSAEQLEKADISFKEINIVKRVFKKQLREIYHARISYPKRVA